MLMGGGGQVKLTAAVVQVNPPGCEENDVSDMKWRALLLHCLLHALVVGDHQIPLQMPR